MAIPVLPESAPFTPEQRAWLNGFLAGALGLGSGVTNNVAVNGNGHSAPALVPSIAPAVEPTIVEDEEFPWHDSTLPIEERLVLADGKPIERRLMATMAQLDCGQCGYLCKTYAEAIASGAEKSLTKCVPGGKETSRKLKELVAAATTANEMSTPTQAARGEG